MAEILTHPHASRPPVVQRLYRGRRPAGVASIQNKRQQKLEEACEARSEAFEAGRRDFEAGRMADRAADPQVVECVGALADLARSGHLKGLAFVAHIGSGNDHRAGLAGDYRENTAGALKAAMLMQCDLLVNDASEAYDQAD